MKNPNTTIIGILTLIGVAATQVANLIDGNPATEFSIEAVWLALLSVGVIASKDAKTKE